MACSPKLSALALVLLCAATIMAAPATADVESYSFPVFNIDTTDDLLVATNMSSFEASLLFQPERPLPEGNVTEGFLVLDDTVELWRASAGGLPTREASFNTSFTVESSATPVSFVILLNRLPTFGNPAGLRGANGSATGAMPNVPNAAAVGRALVEVGTVKSYAPESLNVGLNVTVTPTGTSAAAVWIEYDAVAHLLHVYVGAGGQPRPLIALLDTPLSLPGQGTMQTAFVGFFAGTIRNIFIGVRAWNLTVDDI